jgi:hypothetical protein
MSISPDPEFTEQCRRAAYWVGRKVSVNGIIESGAEEEVTRLEKANGGPFPQREDEPLRRKAGIPNVRGEKVARKLIVIRMEPELLERLKNAGVALGLNYTAIALDGAARVLTRLQRQFGDGKPFPPEKKSAV